MQSLEALKISVSEHQINVTDRKEVEELFK